MFKKFIHWFLGVEFWKTASKPWKIFVITYLVGAATFVSYGWIQVYLEDRQFEKELREERDTQSEPDILNF